MKRLHFNPNRLVIRAKSNGNTLKGKAEIERLDLLHKYENATITPSELIKLTKMLVAEEKKRLLDKSNPKEIIIEIGGFGTKKLKFDEYQRYGKSFKVIAKIW